MLVTVQHPSPYYDDSYGVNSANNGPYGDAPKVANKINVYVGDADSYFLNMGVHMLDGFLRGAVNPKWTGEIVFQPMAPHCWGPPLSELIPKMAMQVDKNAPAGADSKSWKY